MEFWWVMEETSHLSSMAPLSKGNGKNKEKAVDKGLRVKDKIFCSPREEGHGHICSKSLSAAQERLGEGSKRAQPGLHEWPRGIRPGARASPRPSVWG